MRLLHKLIIAFIVLFLIAAAFGCFHLFRGQGKHHKGKHGRHGHGSGSSSSSSSSSDSDEGHKKKGCHSKCESSCPKPCHRVCNTPCSCPPKPVCVKKCKKQKCNTCCEKAYLTATGLGSIATLLGTTPILGATFAPTKMNEFPVNGWNPEISSADNVSIVGYRVPRCKTGVYNLNYSLGFAGFIGFGLLL